MALTDATLLWELHTAASNIGRPNVNPPAQVIEGNFELLAFTVGTDQVFLFWDVPVDYAGGDFEIEFEWTNDGGVDDQNKDIKAQISYQIVAVGDVISGNHVNSPRSVEDTYTSASGWVFHITPPITIPEAEFAAAHGIYMTLTFEAPVGVALTADPHLIGVELEYTKFVNQ